jgi:hydrogenase-4 component F
MVFSNLPLLILFGPLLAALAILLVPSRGFGLRLIELIHTVSIAAVAVLALAIASDVVDGAHLTAFDDWFAVDALGAIFVSVIGVVGFLTGLYSLSYIRHELRDGELDPAKVKSYYGFFSLFLFTMVLATIANNIVLMWVAIEATTLGSAFLVGCYGRKSSLEAAWKYVIICTVGVAFGLYGTVLAYANASDVLGNADSAILWTTLAAHATALDPMLAKLSFVFVLIGFGTKAGLFPMSAWLPDAHSEAPSPVSALLSGVLLKCALLVVIRYYAITVRAVGPEFPQMIVLILGTLSILVAAPLFFVQKDLKRKLAYSSIEHVGLIAVGLGVGGPLGVAAALLHAINHSLAKALMFCGSGNVLMKFHTRDLDRVKGLMRVAPVSGVLLLFGCLALAGLPPFNVFVSEFMVFTAGMKAGYLWLMLLCALFFTITVAGFIQIVAGSVLGKAADATPEGDVGVAALAPMGILLVLVIVTGVTIPGPILRLVGDATAIVTGDSTPVAFAMPWATQAAPAEVALAGPQLHTETKR